MASAPTVICAPSWPRLMASLKGEVFYRAPGILHRQRRRDRLCRHAAPEGGRVRTRWSSRPVPRWPLDTLDPVRSQRIHSRRKGPLAPLLSLILGGSRTVSDQLVLNRASMESPAPAGSPAGGAVPSTWIWRTCSRVNQSRRPRLPGSPAHNRAGRNGGPKHLALLGIQLFQPVDYAAAHVIFLGLQLGAHAALVGGRQAAPCPDRHRWGIHRGDLFVELEHAIRIVDGAIQREGDVFGGRFMVEAMGGFRGRCADRRSTPSPHGSADGWCGSGS